MPQQGVGSRGEAVGTSPPCGGNGVGCWGWAGVSLARPYPVPPGPTWWVLVVFPGWSPSGGPGGPRGGGGWGAVGWLGGVGVGC